MCFYKEMKKIFAKVFGIVEICSMMSLQHPPISLRSPEPADVDFLFQLENDHRLWHVTQTLVPFSRFDLESYILSTDKNNPFVAKQVRLMIEFEENGNAETIGAIDLFDLDALNRRAGIGIVIAEEKRGRGFAGIALSLCTGYAFDDLNLHQLFCNVEHDNLQSLELFINQGFDKIGLKRDWNWRNGKWEDEFLLQKINNTKLLFKNKK